MNMNNIETLIETLKSIVRHANGQETTIGHITSILGDLKDINKLLNNDMINLKSNISKYMDTNNNNIKVLQNLVCLFLCALGFNIGVLGYIILYK